MTANPDFAAGLTGALQSIAQQVISCSYNVPAPPSGQFIDPNRVLVTYTPATGASRVLVQATSSACTDGEWYVGASDGIGVPTRIDLCPATCDAASNDNGAEIKLTFACMVMQ